MLEPFASLRLKPGYTLRAYAFREGGNGNAIVYAMPIESPFPEPDQCPHDDRHYLQPPIPPGALGDIMEAIDGDRSPWSYLSASIRANRASSARAGTGREWSTHTILGAHPLESPAPSTEITIDAGRWEWIETAPESWLPTVVIAEPIAVRFYSHTGLEQERIVRHLDLFDGGKYSFESKDVDIARGPGGAHFLTGG